MSYIYILYHLIGWYVYRFNHIPFREKNMEIILARIVLATALQGRDWLNNDNILMGQVHDSVTKRCKWNWKWKSLHLPGQTRLIIPVIYIFFSKFEVVSEKQVYKWCSGYDYLCGIEQSETGKRNNSRVERQLIPKICILLCYCTKIPSQYITAQEVYTPYRSFCTRL